MPVRKRKLVKKPKNKLKTSWHTKRSLQALGKSKLKKIKIGVASKNVRGIKHRYKMNPSDDVYDRGGVKRLYSHFNKFSVTQQPAKDNFSDSPKKVTLTPKEKSYIMCSCQTRHTRYANLKSLAANAIKNEKIFIIYGYCDPLRKALVERGWVEKIPANRMDLAKLRSREYSDDSEMHNQLERLLLSNFVEKYEPNFIWNAKEDYRDRLPAIHNVTYNRLRVDAQWTTKQGLCESAKNHYWYYIEDVAEVNTPRTYTSTDSCDKQDFEADYKLTACTSLLKWVLSMVANDRPIFLDSGGVAINVIVFALNRCKEFLFNKQNKDIDTICTKTVTSGQWNSFLKKYYLIIEKKDTFYLDKENKLPLYLGYAKFLLKEIHKYRPQLSCEGCHNIWIIKPAHCSRGRGIRMASKLGVLTDLLNRGKYVFQKYIEEPLLVHGTKFDIRQYYLITSTGPLIIWMYKDCYLKFSSQKYSLKNYHESIHLTNNAIQKRYKNCADRHPELPEHNMWSLETYKDYLNKIGKEGIWRKVIYPGMKRSIIGTMLSCQESVSYSKNRFELYGCDFILDKDYKPWLIEINSCPDLSPTTPVTATICPEVLTDIVRVVFDLASNPKASTGRFECIYKQTMCGPRYSTVNNLTVYGYALRPDYFYRGQVHLLEQKTKEDGEKEKQDVNILLHKMKNLYEQDVIMVEPERSSLEVHKTQHSYLKIVDTQSDDDPNSDTVIITEQFDDLLTRITSDYNHNVKTNFSQTNSAISSPSSINLKCHEHADENQNLKSNIRKEFTTTIGTEKTNSSFCFSDLDDGSEGKGSGFLGISINEVHIKPKVKIDENQILPVNKSKSDNCNVVVATKKLLRFLDEKSIEYNESSKIL